MTPLTSVGRGPDDLPERGGERSEQLQNTQARQRRSSVPSSSASIVIVANRGPKDFVWRNGQWVARTASGGLVSMLTLLARRADVAWFCCVSEPPDAHWSSQGLFTTASDQTDVQLNVVPIPVPAHVYHCYYGQISNEILWMLQHHVIGPGGYEYVDKERHRAWNEGYLAANRRLARAITESCSSAQAFLIQDYHLYPLPALLRASFPTTPMLHFTHIPFPDVVLMQLLPHEWRQAILRGMLGADFVGLQTPGDVQAFLACCAELLGAPVDTRRAQVRAADGRAVMVRAYPASVEPRALARTMRSSAVQRARERLASQMTRRTIIRVDRLDPSKNQRLGFLAFARLLEMRPDLRGQVRFLAFLVPSRTDLSIYRSYRDEMYALIEEINERFQRDCGESPIKVFYTNDRDQALAAMESCEVLLINSLEDGMNLVAKEWAVVSQRPGVLIVSETAGVADEASGSAILISPLDVEGTACSMAEALDMSADERWRRLERFRQRIMRWTATEWLSAQLADLGVDALTTR